MRHCNLRSAIAGCLSETRGNKRWIKLVKFTFDELVEHIEKQFKDGMNWDNYGSLWHLDHIKPISLCETFEEAWELSNLQPLEKNKNWAKGNRYIG